MDIAIGMPNAIRGRGAEELVEWARRADARRFSSLGTIDRVVYDSYSPLIALAAAAVVTERIRLSTAVLLAPLRENATALAKQALSVQALSRGRLTLGVGLGAREDDYTESGLETKGRGRRLDAMLERIREVWADDAIGPRVDRPPELLVGGGVDVSFARAARFGDGWIAGGSGPDVFAESAVRVKEEWAKAGRDGEPRLVGLAYYSLGDRAQEDAERSLGDYYAWLGEEISGAIVAGAAKDADSLEKLASSFKEGGCDELILFPASADPGQVDLLADAFDL